MKDPKYTFLRQPDVLRRTGHHGSTLYRLIQAGKFPRPVQISQRSVGWREDQINDWCCAKAEGRTLSYTRPPRKNTRVRVNRTERVRA